MTGRIICGDAVEVIRTLPDRSVHCCVTSPPYFSQRSYIATGDPRKPFEIGTEQTPGEYVERLVAVCREVRRVLRDDGCFFLNIGDCYATGAGKVGRSPGGGRQGDRWKDRGPQTPANRLPLSGIKTGELIGIPWMVAFALRADGWYLKQSIIWAKGCSGNYKGGSVMPESVKNRCTKAHEDIFMFTKSKHYFFDHVANKEVGVYPAGTRAAKGSTTWRDAAGVNARPAEYAVYDGLRNRRSVWAISPKPFRGGHYATFPADIVENCILPTTSEHGVCPDCGAPWARVTQRHAIGDRDDAGRTHSTMAQRMGKTPVPERGWESVYETTGWTPTCACGRTDVVPAVVLDPFFGAGTTGLVAARHGRDYIGIDLNPDYCRIAEERIAAARAQETAHV